MKEGTFDKVTIEYAKRRNILHRLDKNFNNICIHYLKTINNKIQKECDSLEIAHKGCFFKHDDSDIEDWLSSCVDIGIKKDAYIRFEYGFGWGIKVKNSDKILPDKDGCDFFISVEHLPKILGDLRKLKKYWNDELEEYWRNKGYAIHKRRSYVDSGEINFCFYVKLLKVNESFSLQNAKKIVLKAFNDLFNSQKNLNIFIKDIPNKTIINYE